MASFIYKFTTLCGQAVLILPSDELLCICASRVYFNYVPITYRISYENTLSPHRETLGKPYTRMYSFFPQLPQILAVPNSDNSAFSYCLLYCNLSSLRLSCSIVYQLSSNTTIYQTLLNIILSIFPTEFQVSFLKYPPNLISCNSANTFQIDRFQSRKINGRRLKHDLRNCICQDHLSESLKSKPWV